jgi:uncharacterized coiled-coil DUF342 family protein
MEKEDLTFPRKGPPISNEMIQEMKEGYKQNQFEVLEQLIGSNKVDLMKSMSDFHFKIDQVHQESLNVVEKLNHTEEKFKLVMDAADKMNDKVVKLETEMEHKLNNFIELIKVNQTETNELADFCRKGLSKCNFDLNDISIWRKGDVKTKFDQVDSFLKQF